MSTKENKALANRIVEEIFNQGDPSRMDELIAPDGEYRGTEQVKQGSTLVTFLHITFHSLPPLASSVGPPRSLRNFTSISS